MEMRLNNRRQLKSFHDRVDDRTGWAARRQLLPVLTGPGYIAIDYTDAFNWRDLAAYWDTQLYSQQMSATLVSASDEKLFLWELFFQSKLPLEKQP